MIRLTITEPAEQDLRDIVDYITMDNPSAAQRVHQAIMTTARRLMDFPALGRNGRLPHTRKLPVSGLPYLMVYRVHNDNIEILAVLHAARDLPRLLRQRNGGEQAP